MAVFLALETYENDIASLSNILAWEVISEFFTVMCFV